MTDEQSRNPGSRTDQDPPVEIPMTDLEGTEGSEGGVEDRLGGGAGGGIHAVGTPGGGTASGGLGGSNAGDGSPGGVNLDDAMGSGVHDTGGEADTEGGAPYAGPTGGAVGGTPARGRAKGGATHSGIAPEGTHRGDSTIGSEPSKNP